MKIALYVPAWPPGEYASGTVTYASQLVPALRDLGHEVFILTFTASTKESDPYTINLQRFANKSLWNRVALRLTPVRAGFKEMSNILALALSDLIDKHGLNVFETEEAFGLSYAIVRMRLLPVLVRLHGPWLLNSGLVDPGAVAVNRRRIKWEGKAIDRADFVTTPSASVLGSIKKYYGFDLTASRVIRNPIESAAGHPAWDIRTCEKDKILFVGRFDTLKGGDLVLRAFAELAALYPQLTLTFVGPDVGVRNSNGANLSFRQFVQSSLPEWCQERIDFRGVVNRSGILHLRRQHFLTVVASQQEVMPYSVLEAMSLGCPLVATAVGGIPEIITDQRNGLLVPSQDVRAIITSCQMLLNDHAFAARLGKQAWQDCGEYCRPDNIANETVGAYEAAINNFSSRSKR